MTVDRGVESARQALKVAFGVVPFLAGLVKFFNLLADWPRYLSPAAEAVLPVSGQTFMYFAGVVEMVVGLAILTRWTVIGSYVAATWLVAIAGNLVVDRTLFNPARADLGAPQFDESPEAYYNAIPDALFVNRNMRQLDIRSTPRPDGKSATRVRVAMPN